MVLYNNNNNRITTLKTTKTTAESTSIGFCGAGNNNIFCWGIPLCFVVLFVIVCISSQFAYSIRNAISGGGGGGGGGAIEITQSSSFSSSTNGGGGVAAVCFNSFNNNNNNKVTTLLPGQLNVLNIFDGVLHICGPPTEKSMHMPTLIQRTLEILTSNYTQSITTGINKNDDDKKNDDDDKSLLVPIFRNVELEKGNLSMTENDVPCDLFGQPASVLITMGIWYAYNERKMLSCWAEQQQRNSNSTDKYQYPMIHVRHAPRIPTDPTTMSILTTKSGLVHSFRKYDPQCKDQNDDGCILPRSFRLNVQSECNTFFSIMNQSSTTSTTSADEKKEWIIKPSSGYGGTGIHLVTDKQKDLIEPYGECNNTGAEGDDVVQEYIPSYQVYNRNTYLKTWLLYKYGTKPIQEDDTTKQQDPPQAWHVMIGAANHICSEETTKLNDPVYGKYAFICSQHSWVSNPRLNGYKNGDNNGTVPHYEPYSNYWEKNLNNNHYNKLLKNVNELLGKVSYVIDSYAQDIGDYAKLGQSVWTPLGIDIVIDQNLRPWLIEINPCPGVILYGNYAPNENANPFLSAWRIMLSHYQNTYLNNTTIDENSCSAKGRVSRVL